MLVGLTSSTEVLLREIIWSLVWKVVNKPPMTKRTVCYISNVKLAGCIDQAIALVDRFECGILCLDCINLGNWSLSVGDLTWLVTRTGIRLSQSRC